MALTDSHAHQLRVLALRVAAVVVLCAAVSARAATHTVGPNSAGACGGSNCDFNAIQTAIDAASAGDTVTVYFNDDALTGETNNDCYDEHITINKANLTLQGDSVVPASAACIGPSTGGTIVTITAFGVTLKNFEISGKANNGSGGTNSRGNGGRSTGYGIHVFGNDVDDVVIENCTVSFSRSDLIRWEGDRDGDNNGNLTIRNCYVHHSDLPRYNIRVYGGSNAGEVHLVEDCLVASGMGIQSSSPYITVQRNVIQGWSYWGHLEANGGWPETHDYSSKQNTHGGGWRYFSQCLAGVHMMNSGAPSDIHVNNNLIIGTRLGIRVGTVGTISNNTIVNPFNTKKYDYDGSISASDIRDETVGIQVVSGFDGTIENNIVVVTEDNRANGLPGKAAGAKYTPGITGYGIDFFGGSGTLGSSASVVNNNVWGFVDTDGTTATNWGGSLSSCEDNTDSKCNNNISKDPLFATDTSDESNGGAGPCDSDQANSRCYELYHDNYFLKTTRAAGGCHADIRPNTAGYVGFVDMTSTYDLAGIGDCSFASDTPASTLIDWGDGAVSNEPGNNGAVPNLGAFGNTDRGSQSPFLVIVDIDVGDGGVKNDDNDYSGPGIVQAWEDGITELNVFFNRPPVMNGLSSFEFRDVCDTADLPTAPTFDSSAASAPPYRVRFTWPAGTYVNRGIRVNVLADDAVNKIVDGFGEALDGDMDDPDSGTLSSGDETAGGDAQFHVYSLVGDVDGDMDVDTNDRGDITALDGSTTAGLPEDIDGDGTVEGAASEDDYVAADTRLAEHWVNSTADADTATTLEYAINNTVNGDTVKFRIDTFAPCKNATISTNSLPDLSVDNVTIDASETIGVIMQGGGGDGLEITGDGNTIYGLQFVGFGGSGILINGGANNTIGGVYDATADNQLGEGCRFADNDEGISIKGSTATGNTIQGCLIGTNLAGTTAFGNAKEGIKLDGGSASTTIGGDRDDGYGNVISASTNQGMLIKADSNTIKGNYIGLDVNGSTADLGNGKEGIKIDGGFVSNVIGSTTAGEENVIAYNNDGGILLKNGNSDFNTWRANLIYDNGKFQIDNATGGANDDVSKPTISTAAPEEVTGTSSEADGTTVDLYTNTSGDAECEVYVGSTTVSSGAWALSSLLLTIGHYAVAIQTDSNGNSSEISNAVQIFGLTIDTTSDVSDGNTGSVALLKANRGADGKISLREALLAVAEGDAVGFDPGVFPPGSPATIDVDSSALPALDDNSVLLDASNAGVIIEDTDSDLADGDDGLLITGDSNRIVGLQIQNFDAGSSSYGIYITGDSNTIGGTLAAEANTITGNGAAGIYVTGASADGNDSHGNLIYDNTGIAVDLAGDGANNDIATPTISNAYLHKVGGTSGLSDGATVDVYTNTAGDSDCLVYVGSGTVSSGAWHVSGLSLTEDDYAVAIQFDASNNTSEVSTAVQIGEDNNTVIVNTTADVINGATANFTALKATPGGDGISLREALTAASNGKTITFDPTVFPLATPATIDVDSALPALSDDNVTLDAEAAGVIIEDTDSDLADGDDGLLISGSGVTVYGMQIQNFDAGASSYGIYISGDSATIGGALTGQGNTIAANGAAGIYITGAAADGNTLRRNLIYDNTGIAIDLAGDGANDDLAAPMVTAANALEVAGTAVANATVDVFSNNDNNSNCEVYLGSATADGSGDWTLSSPSVVFGEYVVAVQTDGDGDSSEGSSPKQVSLLVDTITDENDGDCSDGDCSLRDALLLVENGGLIEFDPSVFPPATPATIDVDSTALPELDNGSVIIDASNAGVILDDTDDDLGDSDSGLAISGSNNIIRGLSITNFGKNRAGIYITGGSNTIGGVYDGGAANKLGQGCRIADNNGKAIWITGGSATGNTIQGCLIGTDLAGTTAAPNAKETIKLENGANATIIGGDRDDGYGNVISAGLKEGLFIKTASNVIKGNYIGLDVNASAADLGHNKSGIKIDGGVDNNVIGSVTPGEENVIAYNNEWGILLKNGGSDFNTWRGNLIYDNTDGEIDNATGGANEDVPVPTVGTVTTSSVSGTDAQGSAVVDVYTNTAGDSDCLVYVGSDTANGGGNWSVTGLSLSSGDYVVIIQTDTTGNSSEISTAVVVP